ncbi:TatD family hydrolase, partial [Candidatus Uhrbacteria bacterium]|nr:TatD family hydrolase [Candidatus Uhrbacteria bacterium]
IGECGLDFYRIKNLELRIKERQKELFLQHVELAHEVGLPLIIHCRDAHEDMSEILFARFGKGKVREHGVMHCFTGNWLQAQSYLDLGFLISFTGIITFASQYDDVVAQTPLEKMLIETDSPYLTPTPNRGKKNKPLYVRYVAERIAEIKGISFDEVARQTTENACRLFKLRPQC